MSSKLYHRALRELRCSSPISIVRQRRSPVLQELRKLVVSDNSEEKIDSMVLYLRSAKTYEELIARYNPGMDMSEQEKVKLTARRVGLNADYFDQVRSTSQ